MKNLLSFPLLSALCALLFLAAGCALSPVRMLDAKVIEALSRNTNSLHVKIVSIYGTVEIFRNTALTPTP